MTAPPRVRWTVRLGALLLRLLACTWRLRTTHDEPLRRVRGAGERVIFVLWHGELLPLLWHHRGEGIAVVISEHRDGEIIARIAESLGYRTVRGSSTRGASGALIGLIRALEAGADGAVTPDGPRGPPRVFAPGAAVAAQRTGAWIAPIRASVDRGWRLASWDRFLIPKPFARVEVVYGTLSRVTCATAREAVEHTSRLQKLLEDAVPCTG